MKINRIGMLLFDDVELLDFAGPLEVFGAAKYLAPDHNITIETVAPALDVSVSKSLLQVTADAVLDDQSYDLFLIPGGMGTRSIVNDEQLLESINRTITQSGMVASICTGALVLAQLGYLKNKEVCSHHLSYDILQQLEPTATINKAGRYADHGTIVTAAGVSAGIDMSFHLLRTHFSPDFAAEVRQYIEYFPEAI